MPHVFLLAIEFWQILLATREKVDSLGISLTLSQPQIRLRTMSQASRSNKIRVVDISYIALATNALAIVILSFGGRAFNTKMTWNVFFYTE